jgi:hypothetical protein
LCAANVGGTVGVWHSDYRRRKGDGLRRENGCGEESDGGDER